MTTDEIEERVEEFGRAIDEHLEDSNPAGLSEEEIDSIVEEAHQEIPVNSATLLVDEATRRFSSAIWYEKIQEKNIDLAGVGGIGRLGNLLSY